MKISRILFVLILSSAFYVDASDDINHEFKRDILKRESESLAISIRNITQRSERCKIELERMSNDFLVGIAYGVYTLNNVMPYVADVEQHKILASAVKKMSEAYNSLQQAMYVTFDELKEEIALTLDKIKNGVVWFEQAFKISHNFEGIQLNRKNDFLIYAIYKLKHQTELFRKTNAELNGIITTEQKEFGKVLGALTDDNPVLEGELRRALYHLSVLTERAVYKLENWVEVNKKNNTKDTKTVKEVSKSLTLSFVEEIRVGSDESNSISKLKCALRDIYQKGSTETQRLVGINSSSSLGSPEFIRSILFDSITIPRVYGQNLRSLIKIA